MIEGRAQGSLLREISSHKHKAPRSCACSQVVPGEKCPVGRVPHAHFLPGVQWQRVLSMDTQHLTFTGAPWQVGSTSLKEIVKKREGHGWGKGFKWGHEGTPTSLQEGVSIGGGARDEGG